MAMNREHKRLLQRQGQLDRDGNQKAERRKAPSAHRAQGAPDQAARVRPRGQRRAPQGRLADPPRDAEPLGHRARLPDRHDRPHRRPRLRLLQGRPLDHQPVTVGHPPLPRCQPHELRRQPPTHADDPPIDAADVRRGVDEAAPPRRRCRAPPAVDPETGEILEPAAASRGHRRRGPHRRGRRRSSTTRPTARASGSWSTRSRATRRRSSRTSRPAPRP